MSSCSGEEGKQAGGTKVASKELMWKIKMRRELDWEFLGSMNFTLKKKKRTKEKKRRLRILFFCPNSKVAVQKAGPSAGLEGDPQHRNAVVKLPLKVSALSLT